VDYGRWNTVVDVCYLVNKERGEGMESWGRENVVGKLFGPSQTLKQRTGQIVPTTKAPA
jgi:hypothetical protein